LELEAWCSAVSVDKISTLEPAALRSCSRFINLVLGCASACSHMIF
jgi:hypothetical protein